MRTSPDISPALLDAIRERGLDTVDGAFAFREGEDLVKANLGHRRRTQLVLTDSTGQRHELYLKRYERECAADRWRRWRTYGVRTSPAGVEFDNIEIVRAAGISTMQALVCGEQWGRLDALRSYIIVTAVGGRKLERYVSEFLDVNAGRPEVLWPFTRSLAMLVRKLHAAGCVHRDLYNSHVFFNETDGRMEMYLIDLARVFRPKWRRFRWRVKDLAQLRYSMPRTRWVDEYWQPFMEAYLDSDDARLIERYNRPIGRKVARIRARQLRKKAENDPCT